MTSPKIRNVLSVLRRNLEAADIPHALIGAMALSFYGIPRYTADIDLLSDQRHKPVILSIMAELGFDCFQDTDAFAQFDSDLGAYGKIDFMFVATEDGRAILERAVLVEDELLGENPVVQPTDYAVLKLMSMANNPDRKNHDKADLDAMFRAAAAGLVGSAFDPVEIPPLRRFAERFQVSEELEALLPLLGDR
ncbi:MAG: hypothetical protein ACLFUY_11475 [Desulfobacterales bacterium]